MATEILMPALSPTMEEGTLAKWLVKEGDTVSSGDLLAEIETDKATMEFEAVDEGIIGKILVAEGSEHVAVNTAIAILIEEGETLPDSATAAPKPAVQATPEPTSNASASVPQNSPASQSTVQATAGARVFATPLARRLAADKGIDLSTIAGTGPNGRIVKADVLSASASPKAAVVATASFTQGQTATAAPVATGASSDAVKKLYEGRDYSEVSLDGMRKTIAARLSESKQTIPHFYLRRDINIDALMSLRAMVNKDLSERNVKLSVNDFIIKACALALQNVKTANVVWAGDRVLQFDASDIAVAVAIDGGLITPVLRDAEQKSLSVLSAEMKDLAARARDKKLMPQEYQGGSFSISNLGMYGIDNFDAVINPPHAAILAVGAGKKKPIVKEDGELGSATIMSVTLSVDHRAVDGALGALLLDDIVKNLENPFVLMV
ncbi:MAG: pyruvate dehydrogenase complex dihydrolipoamide acetyltransferase [Paracoccaceae bacterium]|jgi:pyruvate dehydrogenase E2 component (dihydrolipoamide acetyltransferase)|nr:pyruvate dehydrogenase complex dihydrolipoamide acetyltransferase [Pseudomonadota bacterium]